MSAWYSIAELAEMKLAGLPGTRQGIASKAKAEGWQRADWKDLHWRHRTASGGGIEYAPYVLPAAAKVQLTVRASERAAVAADPRVQMGREELWRWFEGLGERKRDEARARLAAVEAVEALQMAGMRRTRAVTEVAASQEVATSALYRWMRALGGVARADRLAMLAPRHAGSVARVECPDEAWEILKADYLRLEQPPFADCVRRLEAIAAERGWRLPSAQTLRRRIEAIDPAVLVLARRGVEALKRMYPAQIRDRGSLHALEAVNADGHKWDVFVRFPDGWVGRPVMTAFQDLYSGMMLAWRVDKSENREAVRLAFGDLVEQFGVPNRCTFDNGRNFASKWLTGGTLNRFRFKIRDEDPVGILTQLGVQVDWTQPYSGQSKPIERAFRDFAGGIAKHPEFAGAYVGNNPMAKPENYGSKAVPLDVFLRVVKAGIDEHNARPGRQSRVCGGRFSFREVFEASYAISPITRATAEQRRLWLLAAEAIRADARDGSITLEGNRFWAEFLLAVRGQRVVVRFDPGALQADLHVYRADGAYLGAASCTEAAGFHDADAAREHAKARKQFQRATREMLDAERRMSIAELVAAQVVPDGEPEPVEARVVRMLPAIGPRLVGNAAVDLTQDEDQEEAEDRVIAAMARDARARLRVVGED